MSSPQPDSTVAAQVAAEQQAAPSTLEGWAGFRRAINVTLPSLLGQASQLNATTRRLLGIGGS